MEEKEDGHRREAILTHPDRNRENVAEAAARFAQFQHANETPKNPEEELAVEGNRENVAEAAARFAQFQNANEAPKNPDEELAVEGNRENVVEAAAQFPNANEAPKNPEEEHEVEGNRENVAEAAARFAQFQNANETIYCERQRREDSIAMCGTTPGSPHQKIKNPEEEHAVEGKENNPDFCESISREFAEGAKREREDEERMMGCLKKMNDSLGEIATACEKAGQSLERFEKTITSFVPRIERMYWKSAAADASAPADATVAASGSGSGSGGEKTPLASANNSRAEQRASPKGFWSEEAVESDSIGNEVGGAEKEGASNKRDLSADEHYRTVRESAPSPEPRRGYFNQAFDLSDIISSSGLDKR